MKVRALVSFSGVVSMRKGEEREIYNQAIINDLLQAKYIEALEKPEKKEEPKPPAKRKSPAKKGR